MKKLSLCIILVCLLTILLFPSSIFGEAGATLVIKEVIDDDFPNIEINFSAVDSSGLPIEGLTQNDIEIKENNEVLSDYELDFDTNSSSAVYTALLIDSSGSMKGKPLEDAKEAAIEFISLLRGIDQVKIFVFNDKVESIQDFTSNKDLLINAIEDIEVAGNKTLLYDAVRDAADDLEDEPIGNRAIVLLTDGKDDSATSTIDDAIDMAQENSIPIYPVGFGKNFNEDSNSFDEEAYQALYRFAKQTSGSFFIAEEIEELKSNFNSISEILKSQYSLSYKSDLPKDGNDYEIGISITSIGEVAKDSSTLTTATFDVEIAMDEFEDGFILEEEITITPAIEIIPGRFQVEDEIEKVQYYLDTETVLIEETDSYPFAINFNPEKLDHGEHTIILKVYDSNERVYSVEKIITIPEPDIWTLIYIISGGALALIALIVFLIIFFKRRKKRKESAENIGDDLTIGGIQFEDDGEGDSMSDDETITFFDEDGEQTVRDGGEGDEGETLIGERYGQESKEGQGDDGGTIIVQRDPKKFIPVIPAAWLIIVKGSKEGVEYEIPPRSKQNKRRISIGRKTDKDIVIDDDTISRGHAYIIIEKDKYKIGDAGSANGTFLNGKIIYSDKVLKDGDKINIGDTELVFKKIELKTKTKKKTKKKKSIKKKKSSK